jgi:hypothetical protein
MENFFKKVIDVIWKCLKEDLWKPLLAFFICDVLLCIPFTLILMTVEDLEKHSFFEMYLVSTIAFSLFIVPVIVSAYSAMKILDI